MRSSSASGTRARTRPPRAPRDRIGPRRAALGGGQGIGLMLVRKLAEMHGGSACLRGEGPDGGTSSPSGCRSPPTRPGRAPSRPPPPPATGARILVVDDNVDTARGTARLLQLAGHDVRVAHDGRQALEIAHGHRPRFILLDIGLPGMDGYEVARQLRGDPRHRDASSSPSPATARTITASPRRRDSTITWSSPSTTTPCGPSSAGPGNMRSDRPTRPPRGDIRPGLPIAPYSPGGGPCTIVVWRGRRGGASSGGLVMSRPRRRVFGPLFYSTLVVAGLVVIYAAVLYGPDLLGPVERMFRERRELAELAEALRGEDSTVRERAAHGLITRGVGVSVPILREAGATRGARSGRWPSCAMAEGGDEPLQSFPTLTAAAADGD